MAKKLISVWLSMTILIFSSISIYANENIQGKFFLKNIVVNGENIVNYQLDNPFLFHNDYVYIPLDGEMEKVLGIHGEMDWESRTLKILKTTPTQKNVTEQWMKNNMDSVTVQPFWDIKVVAYVGAQNMDAKRLQDEQAYAPENDQAVVTESSGVIGDADIITDDKVDNETPALARDGQSVQSSSSDAVERLSNYFRAGVALFGTQDKGTSSEAQLPTPTVSSAELNLKGQPVLVKDNIVYIPLTAIVSLQNLGWSTYYDIYSGIYISTNGSVDAQSYFNEPASRYNRGLIAYIRNCNSKVSEADALDMALYFQHYGKIYGVDQTLLMAIAQRESTYQTGIVSSGNCIGLMQMMVSTAKGYGFSKSQLFEMKPNIQMGTLYISEKLKAYGGDTVKALSAYNQGSAAVNRGKYSVAYANRVLSSQQALKNYLYTNGYS